MKHLAPKPLTTATVAIPLSTSINGSTVGQITSQIKHPGILQLGVRITF